MNIQLVLASQKLERIFSPAVVRPEEKKEVVRVISTKKGTRLVVRASS